VDEQRDPALDQALSKYLDSGSEENLEALLHFGPAAFSRVFELSYRGHDADVPRLNPAPKVAGREAIDAVRGLGSRNDELAIGVVEDRLADSDPSVYFAAIRGLAWRDRGRAEQLLRQMVNDVSTPPLLRQQAKEELEALAPP
jgi:hypothetical protein